MDQGKIVKVNGRWRCATIVLAILCLALVITLIAVVFVKNEEIKKQTVPQCGEKVSTIDLSEPDDPGIFHELTKVELKALREYLFSLPKLNLVPISKASVNTSYIFAIDLYLPQKTDSLEFLDNKGTKPHRQAKVVLFRGDISPPVVEEYIVGPLPKPTSCELLVSSARRNPMPFPLRPFNIFEFMALHSTILAKIDVKIGSVLKESYGATFTNCGKQCLTWTPASLSSSIVGKPERKLWLLALQQVEFNSLHPVDFLVLVNTNSLDPSKYFIEKVMYGGQEFSNLDELSRLYDSNSTVKTRIPFPAKDTKLFSTINRRGDPVPTEPQRPPKLVEPDGKRYGIRHRHVRYMQWEFDIRMSTLLGPQVYDIRFKGERIAYEIGLQEISVFYSGNSPILRIADYFDSTGMLGTRSRALIPGADCPDTATFISHTFLLETNDEPAYLDKVQCIFEQNSGFPLRRHMSYGFDEGSFYSGMLDSALHVRSILTIANYDYVIDFVFHQNGGFEVIAMSTGYIASTVYKPVENKYGFKLHDNIIGNIHHHMFHFKVDLDVLGTKNRYETLDISTEEVPNEVSTGDSTATYNQIKYNRKLRNTEQEAAYKFNFDSPKYHIFHNNNEKTKHGVPRSYRVHLNGMSKQLLPKNVNNENSVSWSRYQMAVTKHKDDERESSSYFAVFDGMDPAVNFTSFLADDEKIVDEDLVLWISMGYIHIPHTEDLPVTSTSGGHLGFFLLPYNYFDECPSMASRDAIRLDLKNPTNPAEGIHVEQYGNGGDINCKLISSNFKKEVEKNPDAFLQSRRKRNTF